jgi:hypothetical protein
VITFNTPGWLSSTIRDSVILAGVPRAVTVDVREARCP